MTTDFPAAELVDTGEIRMAVHETGSGPPVILIHGFPELAFSWRHQLPALANAGYRAIAPDMRGYGGTDKPQEVADYTIQKLIGDVTGLMDALELERALIVGHDWGALVGWQMCLLAPERMAGYVALNIPFFKRPPLNPVTLMRLRFGKRFYIVNFQDSDEADRRFAENPRHFIDALMRVRSVDRQSKTPKRGRRRPLSLLEMFDSEDPGGEPLLTDAELDYYADAFAAGGFTGPINWYRNITRNWEISADLPQRIDVPCAIIYGAYDIVPKGGDVSEYIPNLESITLECGHWIQQEKSDEVNAFLLDWLKRNTPARAA